MDRPLVHTLAVELPLPCDCQKEKKMEIAQSQILKKLAESSHIAGLDAALLKDRADKNDAEAMFQQDARAFMRAAFHAKMAEGIGGKPKVL